MIKFRKLLLLPFGWVFGLLMWFRNLLYDWHILPSRKFSIPVISVGNLSVGGTGKTPHVEYLVRLLIYKSQIATLSRGYRRKTRGYLEASLLSTAYDVGDEPLQYINKFRNLLVAVDENRVHGIQKIQKQHPNINLIILDDAFQHRRVRPGLNILLTDFHHLYPDDFIVPAGTLREFRAGASRADMIVVTKTDEVLSPILARMIIEKMKPKPWQKVFFSKIEYGPMIPVPGLKSPPPVQKIHSILLVAGIANPYPLVNHLKNLCFDLETMIFPDHHVFTQANIRQIVTRFSDMYSKNKILVTTEKDAMRLCKPVLAVEIENLPFFYIPISIRFHTFGDQNFDQTIIDYVNRNSPNH